MSKFLPFSLNLIESSKFDKDNVICSIVLEYSIIFKRERGRLIRPGLCKDRIMKYGHFKEYSENEKKIVNLVFGSIIPMKEEDEYNKKKGFHIKKKRKKRRKRLQKFTPKSSIPDLFIADLPPERKEFTFDFKPDDNNNNNNSPLPYFEFTASSFTKLK